MMVFDERDPGCFVTIDETTYFFEYVEEYNEFMRVKKIKKIKSKLNENKKETTVY